MLNPVAARFAAAATTYESAASLQRLAAHRLATLIAASGPPPRRILEIGSGTGLLTRRLRAMYPDALIVATDIAPSMLSQCRASMPDDPALLLLATDGHDPALVGGFDLVCSSLALQWFADRPQGWRSFRRLLAPGGRLLVATLAEGSLSFWTAAHRAEGAQARVQDHPSPTMLRAETGAAWHVEPVAVGHPDGRAFLAGLRQIGADLPRAGTIPLGAGTLRRVLRRFEADHGAVADYLLAYGQWRRPIRPGVFVTGTDTGIGKTLVSACLVQAWGAEYWKPMQTGLDSDPGDTATVQALTGCAASRTHPPALELQAPLSPEAACAAEQVAFDPDTLNLPPGAAPLVVEGAGGVLVPVDGRTLMIDLIARLGLPVVLVARSTLGTINHTLLSLEALRARGIVVAGVVLNGPTAGNRAPIERHGRVRVLAELPWQDPPRLDQLAALFPDYAAIIDDEGST